MPDDADLLRHYVAEGSESAFRALVERYIPLVQATARRIMNGDLHLAQDVTQQVFTDLARKSPSLPTGVILGGWLHRHTCFTAAKAVRSEHRRRARERTAMEINAANESASTDTLWLQLAPVLDDALNHLAPEDRDAIILRYFEHRDLRAIGATLGLSADTAQKRVSRALEKLRALLLRSGITMASVAALETTLQANPIAPVSAETARTVSAHALNGAAAPAAITFASLQTMKNSKLALGIAAMAAVVAVLLFHNRTVNSSPAPVAPVTIAANAPTPKLVQAVTTKIEAPYPAGRPASRRRLDIHLRFARQSDS